jgi:HAD superfamily hydrolase (TIGR01490 family)
MPRCQAEPNEPTTYGRVFPGRSGLRTSCPLRPTLASVTIEAAFFDLDKTIIAKSSVLAFGKPFYREGLLSKGAIVKSIYAQIVFMLVGADEAKMEKLREAMLSLTRGWSQQHIADIVRETLDEVISPIVFAEALELFDQHHAAGRKVVIVSSAPLEVCGPLGEFLGADEVIATRAEIDEEGNYTGELAFYAYGPFKADAIREIAAREDIDLSASYAYSDSVTDLPMLEAVGHPVAVNPDKDLAREAREREWEVRFFQRPVRLRDRVPVPPKGPTIAVGSVLLTAGAGAAAYVLWRRTARAHS